jgi:hypothetical protein
MAEAADRSAGPLLVFIHIPKTGGTRVWTILSENEPGDRTRSLNNVFKGGGGLKREVMQALREGVGPTLKPGTRILFGHVPLGVREYLPRYLRGDRELRYFTFLRDPVERTVSHYFRIRPRHEDSAKFALGPLPADPTLEDMLEWGYMHDNLQTRMLSGLPEPFGPVTDAMLEQAKRNLREGLAFFGLTERFDESLALARRRLGFATILYSLGADGRVNAARPRGEEIPDGLVRVAEECNRYDVELYRYAEALFDSASESRELDFAVELAALQAAKFEGEIETDAPAPEGFTGSDEEWRLLLHAKATVLRQEHQLAKIRAERVFKSPRQAAKRRRAARRAEAEETSADAAPGRPPPAEPTDEDVPGQPPSAKGVAEANRAAGRPKGKPARKRRNRPKGRRQPPTAVPGKQGKRARAAARTRGRD